MEVKFIKCTSAKLSSVPVANGQIICLTDKSALYYDLNSTRYSAYTQSKATASAFGSVKLTDTYTSSQGAASTGIAPSSKALADLHAQFVSMNTLYTYEASSICTGVVSGVSMKFHRIGKIINCRVYVTPQAISGANKEIVIGKLTKYKPIIQANCAFVHAGGTSTGRLCIDEYGQIYINCSQSTAYYTTTLTYFTEDL